MSFRSSSIKFQILKSFFLVSFIPVMIIYIFLGFSLWTLYNRFVESNVTRHVFLTKETLKFLLENNTKDRSKILNYLKYEERVGHIKIWVVNDKGHILYRVNDLPYHYLSLLKLNKKSDFFKKNGLYVYQIFVNGSKYILIFKVNKDYASTKYIFRHIFAFWLVFLVILLIISSIYALLLSYKITDPIYTLKNAAEKIADGNLDVRVDIQANNELQNLAEAFNYMVLKINNSYKQISTLLEHFKNFLNLIGCIIIYFDNEGNIIYANKAIKNLGYNQDEYKNLTIYDICPDLNRNFLDSSKEKSVNKIFLNNKEKQKIPYLAAIYEMVLEGKVFFIMSALSLEDIYILNRKLKEEKEKLLVTLKSIADAVIVIDDKGYISIVNKKVRELTGYSEDEALNKRIDQIIKIYNDDGPIDVLAPQEKFVSKRTNLFLVKKDGEKVFINYSISPIINENNLLGYVIVVRDITVEKAIQDQIIKTEKLKSISLLAGGIAHDFNNIIAAILGNIELVKLKIDKKDIDAKKYIENVLKSLDVAKNLTNQLLTFAKGGEPIKEISSLKDIIVDSTNFVLAGSNIKCHFFFPADLWLTKIDKAQISQVIQNLVINARHAMKNTGNIYISCKNISSKEASSLGLYPPREYIEISIKDQGIGIPKENIKRIFEPFFTTKKDGSGLGLAITASIIHKHNGHIRVESQVGIGTTFYLYLPAFPSSKTDKIVASSQEKYEDKNVDHKKLRILVIDDEELVRETTKEILNLLSYEVVLAEDGEKGLSIYREYMKSNPFDLVILDYTIPGSMNGKDICKQLLKIDPEARVIIASGYANDPVMSNYKNYGFKARLIKPYTIDQLKEAIYAVLHGE